MTAAVLALAALLLGYLAGRLRPVRVLLDWAEAQFEGDGWNHWHRRWPTAVILTTALALHPARTQQAWIANQERQQEPTVFNGAMRPKYNPDWSKDDDHA